MILPWHDCNDGLLLALDLQICSKPSSVKIEGSWLCIIIESLLQFLVTKKYTRKIIVTWKFLYLNNSILLHSSKYYYGEKGRIWKEKNYKNEKKINCCDNSLLHIVQCINTKLLTFRSNYLSLLRIEHTDFHLILTQCQDYRTFSSPCQVSFESLVVWRVRLG